QAGHDRPHSLRDHRGLRRRDRAVRRGVQADPAQGSVRVRGHAARDARDVSRHPDRDPDHPRRQAAARARAKARLMAKGHWLLKSEPEVYPFSQLVADRKTTWDGVRNPQARNFLAAMAPGDLVFFYHSHEAEVVGIASVTRAAFPDPTADDPRWLAVELAALEPLQSAVSLEAIKADPALAKLRLLTPSRLSVMPVEPAEWQRILALSRLTPVREAQGAAGSRSRGAGSRSRGRGRRG